MTARSEHRALEEVVFDLLKTRALTLALAESITGGLIASKLVALAGISECFLGSFVTYSNEFKRDVLGVEATVLERYGAVSEQTAELMLSGIFSHSSADLGVAVTGLAGPEGGSVDKPVGLVYIALGRRSCKIALHRCQFTGDRLRIIEQAATYAFDYLIQYLYLDNP
jgi:nicotinamide-nucleotide amidase